MSDFEPGASLQHGRDCPKVAHVGDGYLHGADDDRCYKVDGVAYCGRCHRWLEFTAARKVDAVLKVTP